MTAVRCILSFVLASLGAWLGIAFLPDAALASPSPGAALVQSYVSDVHESASSINWTAERGPPAHVCTDLADPDAVANWLLHGISARPGAGAPRTSTINDPLAQIATTTTGRAVVSGTALSSLVRSGVAAKGGGALVKYDADFAIGQLTQGGRGTASGLVDLAESQGWKAVQSPTGPLKYFDSNGIERLVIKRGSARTPGSDFPHVAIRNAAGQRVDPYGNQVTRNSPGNHTPITWDLP